MRLLPIALALALAVPATAAAAPVVSSDGTTVLVKDGAAASHVVTDGYAAPGEVRVIAYTDGAPELTAGANCTQVEPAVVSCDLDGIEVVRLEMGGGDDTVWSDVGDLPHEILGEAGDDQLSDGLGADVIDGGPGDDELSMGSGDDEVHGGADQDVASWRDRLDPVEAVLPDTGTSTGNGTEGEDDVLHTDVEGLRGGQGADRLFGNGAANTLDGWLGADELHGMGGADTLDDWQGADTFDGGPGADFLKTADSWPDTAIDCGDDADRLDADTLGEPDPDPVPVGCETVAPEFIDGPDELVADEFRVGHFVTTEDFSVTGSPDEAPPQVEAHWHRCDGYEYPRECDFFEGDLVYALQPADAGYVMYAIVTVRNAAGEAHWPTEDSPVILPARAGGPPGPPPQPQLPPPEVILHPPGFPTPPPPDYRDYGDYADYLDRLSPLEDGIARALRGLARRFAGRDPRTLARRRSVLHRFRFPADGVVTFTWTGSAGAGARAAARVVLARGRRGAAEGSVLNVPVRLTKRGRALLRRAKRLDVTLTASFVGGPATRAAPAEARARFRLRRPRGA